MKIGNKYAYGVVTHLNPLIGAVLASNEAEALDVAKKHFPTARKVFALSGGVEVKPMYE